ncbi:MAG: ABC transporter substrate-binding protein [Deltaproteobacteria bacterium]|nr:ABC transporter substrate-binding protein [Deltaproteobacteria bacterium]
MKNMLVLLIVLFLGTADAAAHDTAAVETMLKEKVEAALNILRRPDSDLADKKQAIIQIVEPLFDFPLMAKLVLGRKHWTSLSPTEQKRFETLFVERLKSSYIDKIDLYRDEQVIWRPAVAESPNKVRIPSAIISKDQEITTVYKLYRGSGQWKIYDVEVQGVSIVTSFRSQFDQILTEGTKEDLFRELESPKTAVADTK